MTARRRGGVVIRKMWEVDLTYKSETGMTRDEWHAYVCGNRTRIAIATPSLLVVLTGLWHLLTSQDPTLSPSGQWAVAAVMAGVVTPVACFAIATFASILSDWIRGDS